MSKYILTVYLKSGQTIEMWCSGFEFERSADTGEFINCDIKEPSVMLSVAPRQIAAYAAREIKH